MTLRLLTLALGCASLLLAVTACDNHDDTTIPETGFHRVRPRGSVADVNGGGDTTQLPPPSDGLPPEPTPRPRREAPPAAVDNGSAAPTATTGDYPYAVPVKDKPGLVTSPYAPDAGYIDVKGQPPGQQMRDPYTQRIFLVP